MPSPATYPGLEGYPPRKNVHHRHLVKQNSANFLNPKLSDDYISRVPPPANAATESGFLIPWQTTSRWTYPQSPPRDDAFDVPEVADEECLSRANIPWKQRKGTKSYIKVHPRFLANRRTQMRLSSNMSMNPLHRMPPLYSNVVSDQEILSKWTAKSLSSLLPQIPAKSKIRKSVSISKSDYQTQNSTNPSSCVKSVTAQSFLKYFPSLH